MKFTLLAVLAIWAMFNIMGVLFGLTDMNSSDTTRKNCAEPMERIAYIFPGYQVGCWLGSVPSK